MAAEKLAVFNDAFVERGVFTRDQGEAVLRAGRAHGLIPRLHADELSDELSDTNGASLAAELGAASADHLMQVSEAGIAALAASGTVANLLPATSFFLMSDRYAPARQLIDRGGIVSLSTDCNPGTCYSSSMPFVIALAVREMGLTPGQAVYAATAGGARALRRDDIGRIAVGRRSDLAVLDAPSHLHLSYRAGVPLTRTLELTGS